ncbi:MAG: M12 family metallopeptidase [Bdellovibrionales bacterium]|nr:M12 family metallopeptidase [Bdellovibrionales bacterium]
MSRVAISFLVPLILFSLTSCDPSGYVMVGGDRTTVESGGSPWADADYVQIDDMILDRKNLETEVTSGVRFGSRHGSRGDYGTQAAAGFSIYHSVPWSRGILPVVFDTDVPAERRRQFIEWGQKWNEGTGVRIVNRTKESEYLLVTYKPEGCYSYVGAARGKIRYLNLAEGCWYEPTVLHEIGHALGLMHEHQRPDRDQYIKLNLDNVTPEYHYAFTRFASMNEAEEYDFLSIMHYGATAFSSNGGRTILVQSRYEKFQSQIGINKISQSDRRVIAAMYAEEVRRRGD